MVFRFCLEDADGVLAADFHYSDPLRASKILLGECVRVVNALRVLVDEDDAVPPVFEDEALVGSMRLKARLVKEEEKEIPPTPLEEGGQWMAGDEVLVDDSAVLWVPCSVVCEAAGVDLQTVWSRAHAEGWPVRGGGVGLVMYPVRVLPTEWIEAICFPEGRREGDGVDGDWYRDALQRCWLVLAGKDAQSQPFYVPDSMLVDLPERLGVRLASDGTVSETVCEVFRNVLERCHGLLGMSQERGYTEIPEVLEQRLILATADKQVADEYAEELQEIALLVGCEGEIDSLLDVRDKVGEAIEPEEIPPTPLDKGGNGAGDETEWVTVKEICAAISYHPSVVSRWAKKNPGARRREVREKPFHYLYAVADLPVEWQEALAGRSPQPPLIRGAVDSGDGGEG